ncbi:hypothetical protein LHT11_05970 [Acetobacter indonesiensis]|uniref:hypothetical protein n=1 Tax=Acetobacter indonesiensis TaxID=104101 RepID=UPI001F42500E|nr:hypothetical protein [Acetobacter indonesiensis]MCG0994747.1 hypothetical protein [Acetobacter indonesiensis]
MLHPAPSPLTPPVLRDDLRRMPLPGTLRAKHAQTEQDCRTVLQIARTLREAAHQINPLVQGLSCHALPLAVLDCSATLTALCEELEQDDISVIRDAAFLV